MVPLKIVSNVSRFKPALNLNRVLADLIRDSNSLNSASDQGIFVSGDGLLLSVSALARAGGRGTGQDTEGGTRHAPEPDKAELGGSEQSYNSLGKHLLLKQKKL